MVMNGSRMVRVRNVVGAAAIIVPAVAAATAALMNTSIAKGRSLFGNGNHAGNGHDSDGHSKKARKKSKAKSKAKKSART
jgi:hypothetical protein